MGVIKHAYLVPRTSTKAILLDDYVASELSDRKWNRSEWEGDSVRRASTCRSVREEHRAWVARQEVKRMVKGMIEWWR